MEQKDYLVRQMEMMGPAIMYMLGIWKDGRIRDAIEYGAEHLENLSDIPLAELDQIHQEEVGNYLINELKVQIGVVRIVAEFLFRIGEIRHNEGHPNGRETLLKAKNLFTYYEKETQTYSMEIQRFQSEISSLLTG